MTAVPTALKNVINTHLPPADNSSRSIQRVCALFLGLGGKKIAKDALHEVCEGLSLFDYDNGSGKNTLAANFTQNMKKDHAYFDGDHKTGWKLTTEGRAEAKRIFTNGEAPTKRRSTGTKKASKKKAKAKAKKKAKAKPKKKAAKKAKKKAKPKAKSKAARKAALRKKRNLAPAAKKKTTKKKAKATAGAGPW